MDFKSIYPNLFQFFAGYFPDADFENLSEKEVIGKFKSDCLPEELSKTLQELNKLITDPPNWDQAAENANRYFQNSEAKLKWLKMIRSEIHKPLE